MDVDVAIVGGGPAGCATALALRARGHSVGIIAAPKREEKPTETSVPALLHVLCELGAGEAIQACEPCYGICSTWGGNTPVLRPSMVNPFGHAWFIHRSGFDDLLKGAARKAGAFWMDTIAENVEFDQSWVGITTTDTLVCARWLVAATGSPSWIGRLTHQRPLQIDSLVALWTRLPVPMEERILFVETTQDGWWYMCPADRSGTIVCFVTNPKRAHALNASQDRTFNVLFRGTNLSGRFSNTTRVEFVRAVPTGITVLPRTLGHRWIAVGDSAARLDPIGSSGTATALDSGLRAARAVSAGLHGHAAWGNDYARWRTSLVQEFVRQRNQHYVIEGSRRESGFWSRYQEMAA